MNSKVQEYVAASKSFVVILRDFLLWANDKSNALICAYECLDHYYYDSRIRVFITSSDVFYYHMQGKRNVKSLLELSNSSPSLSKFKISYFVDSDYDLSNPQTDQLFTTAGYSIENYYISPKAIKRLIQTGFDLRDYIGQGDNARPNPELEKILKYCNDVFDDFDRSLGAPLHAFLSSVFQSWQSTLNSENYPINTKIFDRDIFSTLFSIEKNGFTIKQEITFQKLLDWFTPPTTLINESDYLSALAKVNLAELRRVGRGKFYMALLTHLVDFLIADSKKTKPKVFSQKPSCSIDISSTPPLLAFSPFADSDESLANYIAKIKNLHCI